jgi:pyruvate/2-oxoglutarate dehydrogenase complex dihydrolipoamide dehydrogenase (E3) component
VKKHLPYDCSIFFIRAHQEAKMHYHTIIIGTGQAGPPLATGLANMGHKVAIIEGAHLGGSCVNYGCTPTKTLRASARIAHLARHASNWGIQTGDIGIDFSAVMARKDDIVNNSRSGLEGWLTSYDSLDLIRGWAQFDGRDGDAFRVRVGDDIHTADRVYLNTGTSPFVPPIQGIQDGPYMTNVELMSLSAIPDHLIILGGGYIGLEMGQIMRRLGANVTIIEGAPHVASREDEDVCLAIEALLRDEGITVHTGYMAQSVQTTDAGIAITIQNDAGDTVNVTGSDLLVATGRKPNTTKLNLESVGVNTDERGYIPTDGHFKTNIEGIYALGDINKRGAFTHTSYQDGEIALANAQGNQRTAEDRPTIYAMFTDPPMGRVGMTERQARESEKNVLMATWEMANVSRAKEDGETVGLIKLLVDADTEEFIGATFFGIHGDEIVQTISNYMQTGASYRLIKDNLPIHPTVSEFLPTILGALQPLDEA